MPQRPRRRTAQLFHLRRELATGQLRIDPFKLADALLRREPSLRGGHPEELVLPKAGGTN
ncbi:MAG: hypothetical protein IT371_27355 [Deltaproteobacteria bacterium]|nr:hypothetical protein [Deltaproteobacteria bacterium]